MKTINLTIEVTESNNAAQANLYIEGKKMDEVISEGFMGFDTATKSAFDVLEKFCRASYEFGFELPFKEEK